jgi:hypothetical protein
MRIVITSVHAASRVRIKRSSESPAARRPPAILGIAGGQLTTGE